MGGYLTRDSVVQLLDDIRAVCAGPNAPDFCGLVALILNSPDLVVSTFMGGYDTYVGDNGDIDGECRVAPCNAVSVCLILTGEGMRIDGLESDD